MTLRTHAMSGVGEAYLDRRAWRLEGRAPPRKRVPRETAKAVIAEQKVARAGQHSVVIRTRKKRWAQTAVSAGLTGAGRGFCSGLRAEQIDVDPSEPELLFKLRGVDPAELGIRVLQPGRALGDDLVQMRAVAVDRLLTRLQLLGRAVDLADQ